MSLEPFCLSWQRARDTRESRASDGGGEGCKGEMETVEPTGERRAAEMGESKACPPAKSKVGGCILYGERERRKKVRLKIVI